MSQGPVAQLKAWEHALRHRTALADAERLRDSVVDPRTANAEACWAVMWNKPLYANTYVAIGQRYEEAIARDMYGAWRFIGINPKQYKITHLRGSNASTNFTVDGALANQIRADHKIALHRLLAIQGAAQLLRERVETFGEQAPFSNASEEPLDTLIPLLRTTLGRGWGHITVMHMLTDLGLSVKPDLHLVAAVQRLGLLTNMERTKVPSQQDAVLISEAVATLAKDFAGGSASPANLRYVDKILMEASRQKMLDIATQEDNAARNCT